MAPDAWESAHSPPAGKKAFEHISKRKRKKRRKRKTHKTSSSRAVRTQNSGHFSTSSSWCDYSGGVMSSVACGSSILLGMYWLLQHSANSVLYCAYSWSYGVKVATFIRTRWRTRAVLPSMLAGFAGYDTPRAVFPSIVDVRGDSTGALLGQLLRLLMKPVAIPQVQFLGPGDMPVVAPSGAFGQAAQKTVDNPQLQFLDKVVQISCRGAEADSYCPTVCRTTEFPLLLDTLIDVPVVQVVQLSGWWSQLQFSDTLVTCLLLSTTGIWGWTVPKNCRGSADAVLRWSWISLSWCRGRFPQLQFSDTLVTCPLVVNDRSWRCRRRSFAVMDVAVNLQRQAVL